MLTMTDFIMEQELSLAPEPKMPEKTDEELSVEIVESFMNMSAAFSNAECMFEYAKIADFCKGNELQIPTSIVTEGFKEFAAKVGDVIATIIDWIRGLIAGLCNIFTQARLKRLIAKIEAIDWDGMDKETQLKLEGSLLSLSAAGALVTAAVFGFIAILSEIDKMCTNAQGEVTINKDILRPACSLLANALSNLTNPLNVIESMQSFNKSKKDILEVFNYLGDKFIPKQATDMLDAIKDIGTNVVSGLNLARNIVVPILKLMVANNIPALFHSGSGLLLLSGFKKEKIDELKAKEILDNETILSIRKCARILAKAYDRVTTAVSIVMSFKLLKTKVSDKEAYKQAKSELKDRDSIMKSLAKDLQTISKRINVKKMATLDEDTLRKIQGSIEPVIDKAMDTYARKKNLSEEEQEELYHSIHDTIDSGIEEYVRNPEAFIEKLTGMITNSAAGKAKQMAHYRTIKDADGKVYTPEEFVAVHPDALNWAKSEGYLPQDYVIPGNPSDPENTDNIHNIDEFE